ncbi:catalase-like [Pseudochaenichthys georgianus]|uniref:catalase-like n=1 Tax=Pseudochaenichthys georgianus TaxID=52239 RepID=UPI00146CF121|nr:catalase-like [Pseudochaenichthys georgianus]
MRAAFQSKNPEISFTSTKRPNLDEKAKSFQGFDLLSLQVCTFYTQVLKEEERQRLCQNMAGALKGAQLFIQKRQVENLKAVHEDYGNRVQSLLNKYNAENKKNTEVHVYSRPGASAIAASSKM